MIIPNEIVDDFNAKVDLLRHDLDRQAMDSKRIKVSLHLFELSNRMEIARRVFNIYAQNGIVEIPE